jgi:hypothetical protein
MQEELKIIKSACRRANPSKFEIPKELPLPVRYDGMQYYWGSNDEMIADFDEGVNIGDGFRIRGWGRIQDEKSQDMCARYIEKAINTYSDIRLADVLLAVRQRNVQKNIQWSEHTEITMAIIGSNAGCGWKTKNDNIEDQTPETIKFLAGILK